MSSLTENDERKEIYASTKATTRVANCGHWATCWGGETIHRRGEPAWLLHISRERLEDGVLGEAIGKKEK